MAGSAMPTTVAAIAEPPTVAASTHLPWPLR
jgi:hypothetical protein